MELPAYSDDVRVFLLSQKKYKELTPKKIVQETYYFLVKAFFSHELGLLVLFFSRLALKNIIVTSML